MKHIVHILALAIGLCATAAGTMITEQLALSQIPDAKRLSSYMALWSDLQLTSNGKSSQKPALTKYSKETDEDGNIWLSGTIQKRDWDRLLAEETDACKPKNLLKTFWPTVAFAVTTAIFCRYACKHYRTMQRYSKPRHLNDDQWFMKDFNAWDMHHYSHNKYKGTSFGAAIAGLATIITPIWRYVRHTKALSDPNKYLIRGFERIDKDESSDIVTVRSTFTINQFVNPQFMPMR